MSLNFDNKINLNLYYLKLINDNIFKCYQYYNLLRTDAVNNFQFSQSIFDVLHRRQLKTKEKIRFYHLEIVSDVRKEKRFRKEPLNNQ